MFVFYKKIVLIIFISLIIHESWSQNLFDCRWSTILTEGLPTGRHENSFVEFKGKFYLLGGRGLNPVDVYDPKANKWEAKSKPPIQLHHFQAVVYKEAIYIVGAMTGNYPNESPLENVWIYYPETDNWVKGPVIPQLRRRGGGGTVIYNDKIYIACGIKLGHTNGTNNYFDSYDLKTGEWNVLDDAPHIRDHVQAIVAEDKLWLVGGRNTSVHYADNFGAFFNAVEPQVDYYDFKKEQWFTHKEVLPIPTAAGSLVCAGTKVLYIGGEGAKNRAYDNTQCLDLNTGKWCQIAILISGRHGTGAIFYNNKIYIVAGSPVKGGGEINSMEVFTTN